MNKLATVKHPKTQRPHWLSIPLCVGLLLTVFHAHDSNAATRNRFDMQPTWFMDFTRQDKDKDNWIFISEVYRKGGLVSAFVFVCPHDSTPYLQFDLPSGIPFESIDLARQSGKAELVVNNMRLTASLEKDSLFIDRSQSASLAFDTAFQDASDEIELRLEPYGEVLLFNKSAVNSDRMNALLESKNGTTVTFKEMITGCSDFKKSG